MAGPEQPEEIAAISGRTLNSLPNAFTYTLKEPVGVVAAIVPWNFPFLLTTWKVAPALAAGCTVIVKPATQTPMSAIEMGRIGLEAGLPPGVLQILPGPGRAAGMELVRHAGVDKVAFTGSTEVGHEIVKASAGNLKRVSLELGGKSPAIVFDDADLELAAEGVANAIFFNHGQCCCAGSRLFAGPAVRDELLEHVADIARATKLGDGFDPDTAMGPLVSREQYERVTSYIHSGDHVRFLRLEDDYVVFAAESGTYEFCSKLSR